MFRENNAHCQEELFNSYSSMNKKVQEKLGNSWAPLYYEHVFCKIDEKPFAVLYCLDNGRPNFPVNVLLSLDFIKHMKNYTDEEMYEQYFFNYQVAYALGLRTLGELYLGERTIYDFRERIYRYALENPDKEDLIFGQFENLTAHFIDIANINTNEQRMDSTLFMPNIKLAGRLSLSYDVLEQAIKACPKEILTEALTNFIQPTHKTNVLYRTKSSEVSARLQDIVDLCVQLLDVIKPYPEIKSLEKIQLVQRFLKEQANFESDKEAWTAKENKEIEANSMQSAYDPDATYRKKAGKRNVGYVANLTETCSDENSIQLITDYTVEKNIISDTQMLKDRLPVIQDKMEVTDVYTDGGYYSQETDQNAQESGVTIHYTDMTGRKPDPDKLPITSFEIKDNEIVVSCPNDQKPISSNYNKDTGKLTAHFDLTTCQQCPMRDACPVELQKKRAVLRVSQKSVVVAQTRDRIKDKDERKKSTSKRAAIEGTNSALKRSQGAGKLRVRTIAKNKLVMGMKIIGHNFRQVTRFLKGQFQKRNTNAGILLC